MTRTDPGLYVYGLVPAGSVAAAPDVVGVDGLHPVELIPDGELCALVSKVGLDQFDEQPLREHLADMAWVEQTALRHKLVLDAVLTQCTPIPMRLCTLYNDEEGLRELLDREHDDLSAALQELSGKLEWGVQIFAGTRPDFDSCAPTSAKPDVASGTAYLQSKLAARTADEEHYADLGQMCDQVHAELRTIALDSRLGIPQRPEVSGHHRPMLLNGFYLVRNDQHQRFGALVAELNDGLGHKGIELKLTGPWAPYNFVPAAVGGAR